VILGVCLIYGCAEPDPTAKKAQNQQTAPTVEDTAPSATIDTSSSSTASASPPAPTASGPLSLPANSSTTTSQSPSPGNSSPGLNIHLAGVALAQTLPDGSAMGFGLQYEVVAGTIDPSNTYEWVIEPPQGSAWKKQVTLQRRGELNTFVSQWPPTDGTYTTYIQQIGPSGNPTVVSKKLKMTYSLQ
jgi:hypothetical protein